MVNGAIFEAINGLAGHAAVVDDPMRWLAQYLIFAIAAAVAATWLTGRGAARDTNRSVVLRAGAAAAVAWGIALLIQRLYAHPRPFVERGDVHLLLSHAVDASFPSEHVTVAAAAVGVFLWARHPWGAPLLAATIVLGLARVFVGVHYPADIAAGLALGLAVSLGAFAAPVTGPERRLTRWLPPPLG